MAQLKLLLLPLHVRAVKMTVVVFGYHRITSKAFVSASPDSVEGYLRKTPPLARSRPVTRSLPIDDRQQDKEKSEYLRNPSSEGHFWRKTRIAKKDLNFQNRTFF